MQMVEKTVNVERVEQLVDVFGSFDENVKRIESEFGVKIVSRGDELKIQGRIEEMVVSRGSLHEGNRVVSLTHKLPGPCQHWEDTFFSQESSLLLSQPDSCTAPRQDLSNTAAGRRRLRGSGRLI